MISLNRLAHTSGDPRCHLPDKEILLAIHTYSSMFRALINLHSTRFTALREPVCMRMQIFLTMVVEHVRVRDQVEPFSRIGGKLLKLGREAA